MHQAGLVICGWAGFSVVDEVAGGLAVADADATATKIKQLGGSVMVEPFETPIVKMAVAGDPQGAIFSIIQWTPQPA